MLRSFNHCCASESWINGFWVVFLVKRLKNWEIRERKKAREYNKENEREDERRREMVHMMNML